MLRKKQKLKGTHRVRPCQFLLRTRVSPSLKDVSFRVEPGQVVALLGETGSGKTTLVNLLPRFYDYYGRTASGWTGFRFTEYARHSLRRNIGIVEQEPFLFSMSIRDNIAYGKGRRGDAKRRSFAAAKAAAIHDTILGFPGRLRDARRRTGRHALGRTETAYRDRADARKGSVDPDSRRLHLRSRCRDRRADQTALDRLMEGRTTFIIAHRVQSLMRADLILVFSEGRIIQRGTHEELIAARRILSSRFRASDSD